MARITSSSVNWAFLSQIVSSETKNTFAAFKAQSDKYVRDIASLPTELPKIDWSSYKKQISAPGIVDSFQKSYESLKIPFPSDQGWIAKIEAEGQKKGADFEKVRQEGKKEIAKLKEELKAYEKEIPFSEATLEELVLMRPGFDMYSEKDPKLWPPFAFEEEETKSE